jgi:hypothetical protein
MHHTLHQAHDLARDGTGLLKGRHLLPISKLRGVRSYLRAVLKTRRITTCGQLLDAAGDAGDRARLARETGADASGLLDLVRRADMARVNGIGTVFGLMLEIMGVDDVPGLAGRDAVELHRQLRDYNQEERLARRSPTPEEVADWVGQARALPRLVTY